MTLSAGLAAQSGTPDRTRLVDLLPAVYRIRDAGGHGALEALASLIDGQIDRVEADIAALYDDWFIETCAPWVVPYIGDLLGVRNLQEIASASVSRRAYVANTLAYRRRKGTVAVLEQLARDVTGWPAKAVEFFDLLSTTQFANHLRAHNRTTVAVRSPDVELIGTAFETVTHTGEMRRVDTGRGRYNIPNVGLYLWTLQSYAMEEQTARQVAAGDFRFLFAPVDLTGLQVASPLFNAPEAETAITDLAVELHVPGILRRRPLHDELEHRRQAAADDVPAADIERAAAWFDTSPVIAVRIAAEAEPIPAHEIVVCDLSDDATGGWRRPSASLDYVTTAAGAGTVSSAGTTVSGDGTHFEDDFAIGDAIVAADQTVRVASVGSDTSLETDAAFTPPLPTGSRYRRSRPARIRAGIDPLLGRLALADGETADDVLVSYAYGFPGDVGGGPYDRRASAESWVEAPATLRDRVTWHVGVAQDPNPTAMSPNQIFSRLDDAVIEWNTTGSTGAQPFGLITVMDNATYDEPLTGAAQITVPAGGTLIIAAADWPTRRDDHGAVLPRRTAEIVPMGLRPHVLGDVDVVGGGAAGATGGRLVLDGLLIEGRVTVLPGALRAMQVAHSTLVPAFGGLLVRSTDTDGMRNDDLRVDLVRTITGSVRANRRIEALTITDTIVDAAGAPFAVTGPAAAVGPACTITRSTVLGRTRVQQIDLASESIFAGRVRVERAQSGCLRFSYVPRHPDPNLDSRTPRRYRCQPDLALAERARELTVATVGDLPEAERQAIRSRVRPQFTDTDYGRPGYTQLTAATAPEISTGAANGAEMGVWCHLMNPQRADNLRAALDEYLRFGLEAGSFRVT